MKPRQLDFDVEESVGEDLSAENVIEERSKKHIKLEEEVEE